MIKYAAILLFGMGLFVNGFCDDEQLEVQSTSQVPDDQRIGGSGGLELGVITLDLDPVKKIVTEGIDKGGFDFDNNTFATLGLVGYTGPRRNGVRIGFGGWAGYNSLYSDKWTVQTTDSAIANGSDSTVDSIIQLHLIFAHGGLLIEKSFNCFQNMNLYVGGLLGAGALIAIEERKLSEGAFTKNNNDYDDEWDSDSSDNDNRIASAPLWAMDLHGGFTYSLTQWMHLGVDCSTLFYFSSGGFESKYGSFWTVNPGIKIRLMFGTSV